MRVAVVIPAHNEESALPLVLGAIPEGLVEEVVVVDNASTDGTSEAARSRHGRPRLRLDGRDADQGAQARAARLRGAGLLPATRRQVEDHRDVVGNAPGGGQDPLDDRPKPDLEAGGYETPRGPRPRAAGARATGRSRDRISWARRRVARAVTAAGAACRTAIISAAMLTAISSGDSAPMGSPIGPRTSRSASP